MANQPYSPLLIMHLRGISAVESDFHKYIEESGRVVDEKLELITRDVRIAAQDRSPYLYGVLHGAHRDEFVGDIGRWGNFGRVFIDPSITHPIMGGRPYEYGQRLHIGGRPWFLWTVEQDAPGIIERHGGEIFSQFFQNIWATDFTTENLPSAQDFDNVAASHHTEIFEI